MGEARETVIGRREGWRGSFLRVRVDEVRLPSGRESVREYVDHPGAVAVLPVTADGEILLIRQYRAAIGRTILEIPAGTREAGEDPAETARRELAEETAHAPGTLTEIARFYSSPGYTNEQVILYAAEGCQPIERVAADEETISLVRVPMADLPRLLTDPNHLIEDAQALVAALWLMNRSVPRAEGADRAKRG